MSSAARLCDMVIHQMMGYYKHNEEVYPDHAGYTDNVDVRGKHNNLARTYAAKSIVLLQNANAFAELNK